MSLKSKVALQTIKRDPGGISEVNENKRGKAGLEDRYSRLVEMQVTGVKSAK